MTSPWTRGRGGQIPANGRLTVTKWAGEHFAALPSPTSAVHLVNPE